MQLYYLFNDVYCKPTVFSVNKFSSKHCQTGFTERPVTLLFTPLVVPGR